MSSNGNAGFMNYLFNKLFWLVSLDVLLIYTNSVWDSLVQSQIGNYNCCLHVSFNDSNLRVVPLR